MRLWTLHPCYLDARGLVALWREALLAQAVLRGRTVGYRHHPQLLRFRATPSPRAAIAAYLREVHAEALRRGYRFDGRRIGRAGITGVESIRTTTGQLDCEWAHLLEKLLARDPDRLRALASIRRPRPHPLFRAVAGEREPWERAGPPVGERPRRR